MSGRTKVCIIDIDRTAIIEVEMTIVSKPFGKWTSRNRRSLHSKDCDCHTDCNTLQSGRTKLRYEVRADLRLMMSLQMELQAAVTSWEFEVISEEPL